MFAVTEYPYALFGRDKTLTYQFQFNNRLHRLAGNTVHIRQNVSSERLTDGFLEIVYDEQYLTSKLEKDKDASKEMAEGLPFHTIVSADGTCWLTHVPLYDMVRVDSREGWGLRIPGVLQPGMQLQCGTIIDTGEDLKGHSFRRNIAYSNWKVAGPDNLNTKMGPMECMRLEGVITITVRGQKPEVLNCTCWVARGYGFIRFDAVSQQKRPAKPVIFCVVEIFTN